jgi:5-formyltetrahydrofolate cyclo-ligase
MIKSELRQLYLLKHKSISVEERAAMSDRIASQFFSTFDLADVRYLHSFIPIEKFNEVDTMPIFRQIWHEFPQIQTVVPRVDFETNEISSLKFGPDIELVKNAWDINEPSHDEFIETEKIDMVVVPGVCFDRQCHRVGYGKGFYDRFLKKCRPASVKTGLSYFEPVEKIDDAHDGDVRLDFVITPESVNTSQNRER